MHVLGIDENGLGPRLGPLVATGVTISVPAYRAPHWLEVGKRVGIDDSKQTSSFGHMAAAEAIGLAVVEQLSGNVPGNVDELLERIGLVGLGAMREACPSGSAPRQCWGHVPSLPAFGGDIGAGRERLALLRRQGVEVTRVRTALGCPAFLNKELEEGRNKLHVDLDLFEQIVMDARNDVDAPLEVVCGMVGGIRKYQDYFRHLSVEVGHSEEKAKNGVLRYPIAGVGVVAFEVSADAHHLPVALASMVGKYVRELSMLRINHFYQERAGGPNALRPASGYHDTVTTAFIDAATPIRRRLRIAQRCFQRRR